MTVTITDLTTHEATGGAFDVLMSAVQEHLATEYNGSRLSGPDYAKVYLGGLQSTLDRALQFVLTEGKLNVELEILEIEKQKAAIEKDRAAAELLLVNKQVLKMDDEIALIKAQVELTECEKLRCEAQTALIDKQAINEGLQGQLITANVAKTNVEKALLDEQVIKVGHESNLVEQEALNAVTEGLVLTATKCKLDAEFDVLVENKAKVAAETGLLTQKKETEKAQVNSAGVEAGSVIGKQIGLYGAQTAGFYRDAEQKAAKLVLDTWNVRRTTDEATAANSTNGLYDTNVGRFVIKLLEGVEA